MPRYPAIEQVVHKNKKTAALTGGLFFNINYLSHQNLLCHVHQDA